VGEEYRRRLTQEAKRALDRARLKRDIEAAGLTKPGRGAGAHRTKKPPGAPRYAVWRTIPGQPPAVYKRLFTSEQAEEEASYQRDRMSDAAVGRGENYLAGTGDGPFPVKT